jgi:hypothetical protein
MSRYCSSSLCALVLATSACSHPAGPRGIRLHGHWRTTLVLDSARLLEGKPSGDTARGDIRFGSGYRTFIVPLGLDTVSAAFGTHNLDFTPFWGGPVPPVLSTSVLGQGTSSPITEVFARVYQADSVILILDPRFSHGRVYLTGHLQGDSMLTGNWVVLSPGSRAAGHFSMLRDSGN